MKTILTIEISLNCFQMQILDWNMVAWMGDFQNREKWQIMLLKKMDLNLWILPYQFVPLDSNQIGVGKKGYHINGKRIS